MQRYFSISNEDIVLSSNDIHHIINVMRGKVSDTFNIVFNKRIYLAKIVSITPFKYEIVEELKEDNELKNDVTLFYALSKNDKNDFVIQKASELGVNNIVLISSKRCVCKLDDASFNKKKERYIKIIKEACEQSHRTSLPNLLGIIDINKIPSSLLCDHNFVAYEDDSGSTKNTFNYFSNIKEKESVSILIGSEGGLEKKEVETLIKQGFKIISLGKRILRTETAAVYALSALDIFLEKGE